MLKWLLDNLKTVCAYFTVKQYQHTPSQEWWIISIIAHHFLMTFNITLCALQTDSDVVSKQYDNVLKLLLQLQEHCSDKLNEYLKVSTPLVFVGYSLLVGQFKVTCSGMQLLLNSIDVDAAEIAAQLDPGQVVPTTRSVVDIRSNNT